MNKLCDHTQRQYAKLFLPFPASLDQHYLDSTIVSSFIFVVIVLNFHLFQSVLISDIKALFKVLFMFLPLPVFWTLFDQQVSFNFIQNLIDRSLTIQSELLLEKLGARVFEKLYAYISIKRENTMLWNL